MASENQNSSDLAQAKSVEVRRRLRFSPSTKEECCAEVEGKHHPENSVSDTKLDGSSSFILPSAIKGARQGIAVKRIAPAFRLPKKEEVAHEHPLPHGWTRSSLKDGQTLYVHLASGTVVDSLAKFFDKAPGLAAVSRAARRRAPREKWLLPAGKTPFLPRAGAKRLSLPPVVKPGGDKVGEDGQKRACIRDGADGQVESEKRKDTKEILTKWKNPNFQNDLDSDRVGNVEWRLAKTVDSFQFTKSMFSCMTVIDQVDKKFIAAVVEPENSSRTLLLFDQHAVHERIRLEALIKRHFPNQTSVASGPVKCPFTVTIPEEEDHVLLLYQDKLSRFGLATCRVADHIVGVWLVTQAPLCFLQRETSELKYKRPSPLSDLVLSLLHELASGLERTNGAMTILPKTVRDILNSQACRGAVMFGDDLSKDECDSLMLDLAMCSAPFQCAHGRPSLAPIIDLDKLGSSVAEDSARISMPKLHAVIACMDLDKNLVI